MKTLTYILICCSVMLFNGIMNSIVPKANPVKQNKVEDVSVNVNEEIYSGIGIIPPIDSGGASE